MTGRATALCALSSALLVTAGCGGDRVDRKDLESKVAGFVARQTGITVAVSCPDNVDPAKGTRVTCTTSLSGTKTDLDILFVEKGRFQVHVDTSKLG